MIPVLNIAASDGARAAISPHGAHITSWIPRRGGERLYLSSRSQIGPGLAIRGGIPVIFPQFASEGPLSKHGFARGLTWQQIAAGQRDDGAGHARFELCDTAATRAAWPHAFVAQLDAVVGGDTLEVSLSVRNGGSDPFSFTAALHTYLRVSDIAAVRVGGLAGLRYRDAVHGNLVREETADALPIVDEVDRVYFDAPATVVLDDGGQPLRISNRNFADLVVWNPGPAKAAALNDLDPDGWRQMLCLEGAAIGRAIELAPGENWSATQTLSLA